MNNQIAFEYTENNITFPVKFFTGKVAEIKNDSELKVYGSGDGGSSNAGYGSTSNIKIESETIKNQEIFLINEKGTERAFKLVNWDITARKNQTITICWIVDPKKEWGPFFYVYNHNLKEEVKDIDILGDILFPGKKYGWLSILTIAAFIFFSIKYIEAIILFIPLMFFLIYIYKKLKMKGCRNAARRFFSSQPWKDFIQGEKEKTNS